ncbi:MAG: hypothetical protein A3J46_06100 [Candidatus Yanofskybacteria bacterium RIFCSPHIGHO2_02_FULL_41_11]|uniref:Peptidase M16 n=1 Tax=Candidatus Yanofskybacteria bacterium RIFCSPHIGHO2_02_FULL_41_11 TaxID=1802675 RepID=A0A1F8F952_9BACT|nr:MAG: hypothetical protein A3J46_06100 [Candidatus Yanofskybacteria bacterium RIFCSPHIGHO2_02_FULL_41_11]
MQNTFNHKLHAFNSGLRLVVVPMKSTKTATVLVLVGTGSKYETKEINGISHFLEHMMFKGTTKRPDKLEIARELESIGADFSAFTHKEFTGYYARASVSKLDTLMDVVFDIFLNSKLDEKEIEKEKGVIVEEINMYRDTPQRYVSDLFEQLLYGDQPAGWDIAGEKNIVIALKRQQFVDYFTTHYIASNTVIAVAGNVKSEEIKEKVGQYFENIRQAEKVIKLTVKEEQLSPRILLHYKKTDQSHFILGFRGYDMFNEKRYAAGVLATVLGGGMSSRLFTEIRDKRGLAYYVGADTDTYTDTGIFAMNAGVNNDKADDAIKVMLEEADKLKSKGITARELQQAKDQAEGALAIALENSRAVANAYAGPVLFYDEVLTPEEELDKIKKVTLEQVLEVASEIFDNRKLNLSLIGPFEKEEEFKKILKF